jgi:hypothetical protein
MSDRLNPPQGGHAAGIEGDAIGEGIGARFCAIFFRLLPSGRREAVTG